MLSPVTIASTRCEYASGAASRARTASRSRIVKSTDVEREGRLGLQPLELRCDGVDEGQHHMPPGGPLHHDVLRTHRRSG